MHTKMARTDSIEYFNLVKNMLFRIIKMIATSGFLTALECTKSVFGRGSAPDPAGGAHDAPPDPLIGEEGDTPSPRTPPPRRLRRLALVAFGDELSSPTVIRPLEPPSPNPGPAPAPLRRTEQSSPQAE